MRASGPRSVRPAPPITITSLERSWRTLREGTASSAIYRAPRRHRRPKHHEQARGRLPGQAAVRSDEEMDTVKAQPDSDDEEVFDTFRVEPSGQRSPSVRVAYLEPLGDFGERVRIGAEPLVVGRGSSCALRIDDRRVSSEHALLQATRDGVCVRDLSSTNGTFVDERRTDQVWLTASAILTFGTTSFRVVFGDLGADGAPSSRSFGGVIGRAPAMLELFALLG